MTKIEWTEASWNVVVGCSKISPGCDNCYAERMANRLAGMASTGPIYLPVIKNQKPHGWNGKTAFSESALTKPLHWKKPRMIFVCSMGDLFHESIPFEWIDKVFAVMALCPQHTFQVLTKRSKRMLEFFDSLNQDDQYRGKILNLDAIEVDENWPLPNVWLGVTAEDQQRADERIPDLLKCPAVKRFVSCEPLLSEINLGNVRLPNTKPRGWDGREGGYPYLNCLTGREYSVMVGNDTNYKLDWVICGGESGPGARPMHPDWARNLRDQCKSAGVPYFMKQWGEWAATEYDPADCLYRDSSTLQPTCLHTHWQYPKGEYHIWGDRAFREGDPISVKCGKKKAGYLLDGKEYKEMPEVCK